MLLFGQLQLGVRSGKATDREREKQREKDREGEIPIRRMSAEQLLASDV